MYSETEQIRSLGDKEEFMSEKDFVEKYDKFSHFLGMKVEEARNGYAKVSMPLTDNLKNGMGFAHGGALFALADFVFGLAANHGQTNITVTLNSSINYLRPCQSGTITAEAHVLRQGQHITHYDVKVFNSHGEIAASCQFSGFLTEMVSKP